MQLLARRRVQLQLETSHMIQNNCRMRKLNMYFVAMATKPLRAHLKRCDWREPKRPHTGS